MLQGYNLGVDWTNFIDGSPDRAVRPLVPRVLGLREQSPPGVAVDLGSGDGTESRFLAVNGWRVHSFDSASDTQTRTVAGLTQLDAARITPTHIEFEELQALPRNDLTYAGRSLPFCAEESFPRLWSVIRASIRPSGWFVGDFFGLHDSWLGRSDMNFHSREEIELLLNGLEIFQLTETEGPADTPFGTKHMHILTVMARS